MHTLWVSNEASFYKILHFIISNFSSSTKAFRNDIKRWKSRWINTYVVDKRDLDNSQKTKVNWTAGEVTELPWSSIGKLIYAAPYVCHERGTPPNKNMAYDTSTVKHVDFVRKPLTTLPVKAAKTKDDLVAKMRSGRNNRESFLSFFLFS